MERALDRTNIFKKYQNKWVALTNSDKVISVGSSLDEALTKAIRKGFENPIVTKIPVLRYDYLL